MPWVRLYYFGTVILGMSEETFWKTTMRKLMLLIEEHTNVISEMYGGKKNKPKKVYIDQIGIF